MKKDFTDVTVVLDRSGSMQSCLLDAQGGLNAFVDTQKQQPGECSYTLVEFDTTYHFVHRGVPIKDVPEYKLVPRGNTALLDAVGRAINETGERLDKLPEHEKPSLVVFVIVTDGAENASKEFTRSQVREMIERQQNTYNWQFTFLGANHNAFREATSLGISASAVAQYSTENSAMAFAGASSNVSRMRSASAAGDKVENLYTAAELKSMF